MKGKDLRKLTSNVTEGLKTCDDAKKRWYELITDIFLLKCLTLFRMGLFGVAQEWARKAKTLLVLPTSEIFHQKLANFAASRNIDIVCILIHNF